MVGSPSQLPETPACRIIHPMVKKILGFVVGLGLVVTIGVIYARGVRIRSETEYTLESTNDTTAEITVTLQNTATVKRYLGFLTIRKLGPPFRLIAINGLLESDCVSGMKIRSLAVGKRKPIENIEITALNGTRITPEGQRVPVQTAVFQAVDAIAETEGKLVVRGELSLTGCGFEGARPIDRKFTLSKKRSIDWES